ncbi:MAG: SIMPL domain-containing protein [Bacteroidetes bacterium]|nr:SIMPL domain-containing protein [Bacteroidota bacterium]
MKLKLFFLCVVFSLNLFAQDYLGDNKLVVIGNSKLIVESDRASFKYKIIEYGSDLREAVQKAKDKVSFTVQILNKYGISNSNISTSFFKSGENAGGGLFLSSSEDFKTIIETYVIVDSLQLLEDVILALSEAKIYDIYNVNFSLHHFEMYDKKVRELAIEDAKNKAQEIANGFGVKIKKAIYIEESKIRKSYPNPFNPSTNIGVTLMEISRGGLHSKPIKLTNQIKVVFEIE